jgi:prevent-host-death family protein
MADVSIRDLRNHGGEVIDRVQAGEQITITRDGRPVALLVPVTATSVPVMQLMARWRRLPAVDPVSLREDIDAVLDTRL